MHRSWYPLITPASAADAAIASSQFSDASSQFSTGIACFIEGVEIASEN
jgi:hypothetical protein